VGGLRPRSAAAVAPADGVWYISPVPRHRPRRLRVFALPIAVLVLLGSGLPSRPIEPLGEVRGVAAAPPASPAPSPPPVAAARDPRLAYARPTDRDTPRAGRDALAPRPVELTGYVWPLGRGRLTLPFKAIPGGTRIKDGKLFHDGIDLASFCGDTVVAAHDGVVLAAGRTFDDHVGWLGDLGPYYRILDRKKLWDDLPIVVVVDDGNGYRSVYAHFSKVTVKPGDNVTAGRRIGYEGRTGHASGCHVHYSLFSPFETDTMGVREDLLKKLRLPELEIARIDPLVVLPRGAEVLKSRRIPSPASLLPTPAPVPPVAAPAVD
jgi:murein DD-endopeptidase MepM/ murein hydrolase activator NlpD